MTQWRLLVFLGNIGGALIVRFGPFELDEHKWELKSRGTYVHLVGKPLDVLVYLIQNRSRLVPNKELYEQHWPGQQWDSGVANDLDKAVSTVCKALGQEYPGQYIRTVRGKGRQFVVKVDQTESDARGATLPLKALLEKANTQLV